MASFPSQCAPPHRYAPAPWRTQGKSVLVHVPASTMLPVPKPLASDSWVARCCGHPRRIANSRPSAAILPSRVSASPAPVVGCNHPHPNTLPRTLGRRDIEKRFRRDTALTSPLPPSDDVAESIRPSFDSRRVVVCSLPLPSSSSGPCPPALSAMPKGRLHGPHHCTPSCIATSTSTATANVAHW